MKQEEQLLIDQNSRQRKAYRILKVLAQQTGADLSIPDCVDIGCAYGLEGQMELASRSMGFCPRYRSFQAKLVDIG